MSRALNTRILVGALATLLTLNSCIFQQNPELVAARRELSQLQAQEATLTNYEPGSYEHFVSHKQYPTNIEIYKNPELMAKADKKSRVVICLAQQRGRLYVDGQVAADWPVSTGIPGRETPAGKYTVLEKKEDYASNRYGKFYNKDGRCVNSDADVFTQAVPEGGRFAGSPMPCWMRLTWDGIGMHIGRVKAGARLSHGCIRTPRIIAEDLYKIVGIGTKVAVNKELEPEFPAQDALSFSPQQGSLEQRMHKLQEKIYKLTEAEQKDRS